MHLFVNCSLDFLYVQRLHWFLSLYKCYFLLCFYHLCESSRGVLCWSFFLTHRFPRCWILTLITLTDACSNLNRLIKVWCLWMQIWDVSVFVLVFVSSCCTYCFRSSEVVITAIKDILLPQPYKEWVFHVLLVNKTIQARINMSLLTIVFH